MATAQEDLQSHVDSLGTWYQRIDFGDGVVSDAPRWQGIEEAIIAPHVNGGLEGKRVLELAANACGLSVILAERGAQVTAVEPIDSFFDQARFVIDHFGLGDRISLVKDTVYHAHTLGQFDIVIFHGLIYHLRHPQLALDMLSHVCTDQIFVSAQTIPGDDPILRNRRANTRFKRIGMADGPLLGWEMTTSALRRMVALAGFVSPRIISEKPHHGEGNGLIASNDTYLCADAPKQPVPVPFLFEEGLGNQL